MTHNPSTNPNQLPALERGVLQRIWLAFAGQVFDEEKLLALNTLSWSGAEVMTAFLGLREEGWIHAVKKAWGERLYFIPQDRLYSVQAAFFTPSEHLADVPAASLLFEAKPGLALDMFNTLAYIARNGGLPLTSKGTVHKKHIQKLDEPEGLTGKDITAIGLEYAHSDVYPARTAVLLDLLLSLGLVTKDSQALVLKEDALREWLELPLTEMNHLLFQSIMERYGRNHSESQHFRLLLCHEAFREDVWYNVSQLLEEMAEVGMLKADRGNVLHEEAAAWLRFLAGAGWADAGTTEEDELLIRWKVPARKLLHGEIREPAISAPGYLFIQPDYEVLVPPDTPFTVRWSLALCAERVSDDHMSVYRLTKASVAQAADMGMKPEQVADFVERQARSGVPDNVEAALSQWGREVGRTSFAELTVLQCQSAEEGDEIEAHPKLTSWIYRLGPLHFAVEPEHVSEIRKILTVAGLPPKRQLGGFEQTAGKVQSVAALHNDGKLAVGRYFEGNFDHFRFSGLVYSGRNERYYDPDSEIPDRQSLFPGLAKIPVMWTRDWRSYHGTTAKQIMEHALDWKVRVELGIKGGKAEFIPQRLLRNPWRIFGMMYFPDSAEPGQIELVEGDWQEMRLVIPV